MTFVAVCLCAFGILTSESVVRTSGRGEDSSLEFAVQLPDHTLLDGASLALGASIPPYTGDARQFCFNNGELGNEAGCAGIPAGGLTMAQTIHISKSELALGTNTLKTWIADNNGGRQLSEILELGVHAGTAADSLGPMLSILVPRDGARHGDEKSVPLEFDVRDFPRGGKVMLLLFVFVH